jgi:hypothetical protein
MSEFSTRSMLDVVVSDRSVKDARQKVEDGISDRSLRASIDPTVSGRNGGTGRRSVRDIFETQTELLVQIRDTLEESAFDRAGRGGGGTTIVGTGFSAAKTLSVGAITVAGLPVAEYLKRQSTTLIEDMARNDPTTTFNESGEGPGTPVSIATDPLSILQNVGEGLTRGFEQAGPEFRSTVYDAMTDAFSSSGSVLQRTLRASQIGERIAGGFESTLSSVQLTEPRWLTTLANPDIRQPEWLSDLTQPNIGQPEWLSDLTNPQFREPQWVSQLTSVLDGGGGRSSGPPQAGARIPGSEINANVSVDGSGLQRDFERALSRALRTRDLERFIIDTISDEFGR